MFRSKSSCFVLACVFSTVVQLTVVKSLFLNSLKDVMCPLETKQLIEYYGYIGEEHNVITEDGYNLTIFRCNSKSEPPVKKKVVVVHHGLLSSSDDYCINNPRQGLAYVLADAGFDVWLSNARGSYYSRRHTTLCPRDEQFWNFSWYEIGIYDYPAVFEYVIKETKQPKVYTIGSSQGTTALLVLLSERPEYNNLIHAASLMTPVVYLKNAGTIYDFIAMSLDVLRPTLYNTELLPRSGTGRLIGDICDLGLEQFCASLLEVFLGQSEGQQNSTMLPIFICHGPSGASSNQLIHYGFEVRNDYFGRYMRGSKVPPDFDLSRIRTPISLHYSPWDKLANPKDVGKLITKLDNSLAHVQVVNQTKFNHVDFLWGIQAAKIVYADIISFFKKHP